MKLLFTIALAGLFLVNSVQQASATIIGPDTFGYVGTNETGFSFQDISSTGTLLLTGDDVTTETALGFNFDYYGSTFNSVGVSTNGLMTFGFTDDTFINGSLSSLSDLRIAVLWDDWITKNTSAGVFVQTIGSAGSRQFITQWNVIDHFNSSPSAVTFQSVLYEGSNNIRFNYLDVLTGDDNDNGASATVGIRGLGAGEVLEWSVNQAVINEGESILWSSQTVPEPNSLAVWSLVGSAGLVIFRFKSKRKTV